MSLTAKQIRFCEEYIVDLNATQAAIRAGYSKNSASEIGWENLRKPQIRSFIDERLKERGMSADEAVKLMADIAKSNLNEYFIIKKVKHVPEVEVSLKQIIKELQEEIEIEEQFAKEANLSGNRLKAHIKGQTARQEQLIRLRLELKRDPKATRFVPGKPIMIERAELDLPALVRDKEGGKIQSIQYTEFGPKVELYRADAAVVNFLRIHGKFEKDNRQQGQDIVVNIT